MSTANPPAEHPASAACAASPCINVCKMDAQNGRCIGCLRTLAEIAAWSQASNAERRCILVAVESRRTERQRQA